MLLTRILASATQMEILDALYNISYEFVARFVPFWANRYIYVGLSFGVSLLLLSFGSLSSTAQQVVTEKMFSCFLSRGQGAQPTIVGSLRSVPLLELDTTLRRYDCAGKSVFYASTRLCTQKLCAILEAAYDFPGASIVSRFQAASDIS